MKTLLRLFAALFFAVTLASPAAAQQSQTQWRLAPSEGLDALLLIGAASGDRLQAEFYTEEIAWVRGGFSAEGNAALDRLYQRMNADGELVGPNLVLWFSVAPFGSLAEVQAAAVDAQTLVRPGFQQTLYWDEEDWARATAVMPDVIIALNELQRIGFSGRWNREWRPDIEASVARYEPIVSQYDVVGEASRLLGRPMDPEIFLVLVRFSQPYGIRVTGQRFLAHYTYRPQSQIFIAGHEIFHPPFVWTDWRLQVRTQSLQADPWVRNMVEDHDPNFGYNAFEDLFDEDSTEALDQIVNERMGVAQPAGERWREHDGGMHLMAAALYHAMKEDGFDRRGGSYQDWLISAFDRGMLTPEEVRRRARAVVGAEAVNRWNEN